MCVYVFKTEKRPPSHQIVIEITVFDRKRYEFIRLK